MESPRGTSAVSKGPTRSLGVPGSPEGVKGTPRYPLQGIKRGVRGVPEAEGSLEDPRGLRGTSGLYQGFKEAPGICNKYNIKESLPVKYVFLISQETNG